MLWEHRLIGECVLNFSNFNLFLFFNFSQTCMSVSTKQLDYELEISIVHRNAERII